MMDKRAARRRFLKEGAAFAGLALTATSASGQDHDHGAPATARHGDLASDPIAYGQPSRFVKIARIPMPTLYIGQNLHGYPNGLGARTPVPELTGSITRPR